MYLKQKITNIFLFFTVIILISFAWLNHSHLIFNTTPFGDKNLNETVSGFITNTTLIHFSITPFIFLSKKFLSSLLFSILIFFSQYYTTKSLYVSRNIAANIIESTFETNENH